MELTPNSRGVFFLILTSASTCFWSTPTLVKSVLKSLISEEGCEDLAVRQYHLGELCGIQPIFPSGKTLNHTKGVRRNTGKRWNTGEGVYMWEEESCWSPECHIGRSRCQATVQGGALRNVHPQQPTGRVRCYSCSSPPALWLCSRSSKEEWMWNLSLFWLF